MLTRLVRKWTATPASDSAWSAWSFAAWWLGLLLLHVVSGAYYAGVALFYHKLPKSNLSYQFRTYSVGISESEYRKVSNAHVAIAAIHGVCLALMVVGSVSARQLVFYPIVRPIIGKIRSRLACSRWLRGRCAVTTGSQLNAAATGDSQRTSSLTTLTRYASSSLRRTSEAVFGSEGLLGVDSVYFDHLLLVREFVETGLQTYQLYRMSRLLPRLWLIRVYAVLLVANCWCVPILHRVYVHRHRRRRLMSLMCDAVLDLVSSMGVSFFLFCVYAPQYTDARFGFPFNNWYDDQWFTSVLQEFQMLLVVSWSDMASRAVFAFGVLQCMESLKDMLSPERRRAAAHAANAANAVVPTTLLLSVKSPGFHRQPQLPARVKPPSSRLERLVHFVLHVVGPGCFIMWGLLIVFVQLHAESQQATAPCRQRLRPWFKTTAACSLVEIDCHVLGVTGGGGSLDGSWTAFEPGFAAGLVVRHCPALEMPAAIHEFQYMASMKIYNSSIHDWSTQAALTTEAHSRLRSLYVIRVNFTDGALPPGLVSKQFPRTFRSFIASASNLRTFPDDLDAIWPRRMVIGVEFSTFTAIPDVIIRVQPGLLSFSRSPIASLPARLFELPTIANLIMTYTNLQELPRNVTKLGPRLYVLFVEGTNVSTFWSWTDPIIARAYSYHKGFFSAHGTPYCDERGQILDGTRSSFSMAADGEFSGLATVMDVSTPARLQYVRDAVNCAPDRQTLYPLAAEDAASAVV